MCLHTVEMLCLKKVPYFKNTSCNRENVAKTWLTKCIKHDTIKVTTTSGCNFQLLLLKIGYYFKHSGRPYLSQKNHP